MDFKMEYFFIPQRSYQDQKYEAVFPLCKLGKPPFQKMCLYYSAIKKEQNFAICSGTDGLGGHYAKVK